MLVSPPSSSSSRYLPYVYTFLFPRACAYGESGFPSPVSAHAMPSPPPRALSLELRLSCKPPLWLHPVSGIGSSPVPRAPFVCLISDRFSSLYPGLEVQSTRYIHDTPDHGRTGRSPGQTPSTAPRSHVLRTGEGISLEGHALAGCGLRAYVLFVVCTRSE